MQKTTSSPHPGYLPSPHLGYYILSSSRITHPLLVQDTTSSPHPGYYIPSLSRMVLPLLIQFQDPTSYPYPGCYLLFSTKTLASPSSRTLPPFSSRMFVSCPHLGYYLLIPSRMLTSCPHPEYYLLFSSIQDTTTVLIQDVGHIPSSSILDSCPHP
jgi:hypothetical protein